MRREIGWINIFIRDVLLTFVMGVVNYLNSFKSWWLGFTTGMLLVMICWHFSEYMNNKRKFIE